MAVKRDKRHTFWEVFYKHDTSQFEVLGPSADDTDFTNKVWEMQQMKCRVQCQTIPHKRTREQLIGEIHRQNGYTHVENLFCDTYCKSKMTEQTD